MPNNIKKYYQQMIAHLTESEWEALESRLQLNTLRKGDYVVKQGEVCNDVYFIETGFLRFYTY